MRDEDGHAGRLLMLYAPHPIGGHLSKLSVQEDGGRVNR